MSPKAKLSRKTAKQPQKLTAGLLRQENLRAVERVRKATTASIYSEIGKQIANPSGMRLIPDDVAAKQYARCLVEPIKYSTRIPQSCAQHTTLITTKRSYSVPMVKVDNQYRYAAVFQPKFGSLGKPQHYQAAFVDFSVSSRPDLTDQNSWIHNIGNVDIALDQNMPTLLNQTPAVAQFGVIRAAMPGAPNALFSGCDYFFQNGRRTTNSVNAIRFSSAGLESTLKLRPGNWSISVNSLLDITTAGSTIPIQFWVVTKDGDVRMLQPVVDNPDVPTTAGKQYTALYNFSLENGEYIKSRSDPASGAVKYQNVIMDVTSTRMPGINDVPDWGMVEALRPVAMTVLAANTSTQFANGGMTGIMLTPYEYYDKIFSSNPEWLSINGMSSVNPQQTKINPFKQGSFCWWKPLRQKVLEWNNPSKSLDVEYPAILLVGEIPVGVQDSLPSMEITFEIVYEVIQGTQLFERVSESSTTNALDMALNAVGLVNSASENPKHESLFKDVGSVLGGLAGSVLAGLF